MAVWQMEKEKMMFGWMKTIVLAGVMATGVAAMSSTAEAQYGRMYGQYYTPYQGYYQARPYTYYRPGLYGSPYGYRSNYYGYARPYSYSYRPYYYGYSRPYYGYSYRYYW
jgi:hypothetical protein